MTAYKKAIFYISFGFWLTLGVECFSGGRNHTVTVKTGGSVTIPCHYDEKNPPQKKYWFSDIDQSYTYTNTTEENLSVIDHPDQSLFTVTMRNLQSSTHDGDYYCTVETEGKSTVTYELHLQVQSAPDVSVKSSSVSGHEGDNVSVQCFYTSGYQDKLKRWCRYKDKACYTEKRTDTSQNSSVQISDDGRSSFTVLMTGLRLSDSGWYFCSAGDLQVSVQLTVTVPDVSLEDPNVPVLTVIAPKPAVVTTEASERNRNATLSSTKPINNDQTANSEERQNEHYGYLEAWIPVVVLLLLMVVVVVSIIILRKKHNRNNTHNTEVTRDGDSDAGNSVRSSSAVAENDVTYSSVTVQPKTKTKAFSPVSVEDEVTYSSVHKQ